LTSKAFPAKILLLGEYTVTLGAPALAIPFFGKSGHWVFEDGAPDESLSCMADFIEENHLTDWIHTDRFRQDVLQGLRFSSQIPAGYGLGSSGALVAAVYEQYGKKQSEPWNKLRDILSSLEACFHSKSSGIDPLVSYLKEAVMLEEEKGIVRVTISPFTDFQIFLLDSFQERNTEVWVKHFRKKMDSKPEFAEAVQRLAEWNKQAIFNLIANDMPAFWRVAKEISRLQFTSFPEFIPKGHESLWEDSLLRDDLVIKLCGAGGGGYTLGFTKNMASVMPLIRQFSPVWVS
jgi:mevalonate kinase